MEVDPMWWDTAFFEGRPLATFLDERDVAAVLRFMRSRGFSRARLAAMTGMSETRIRQISQGRQRVTSYEVLERVAIGLRIPRQYLGVGGRGDQVPTNGAHEHSATLDRMVQDSWGELLAVLAARSNTSGCAGLRRPVEGQLRLVAVARAAADGRDRLRLLVTEARWTEFLSWIESNSNSPARADPLLERAYTLATEAQDQHLAAYILMRKSQQALDDGDATRAVGLARRARQLDLLPPRTSALCLIREAEGHATTGDSDACRQNIDLAFHLASAPSGTVDHLSGHCTVDYVRACEARCRQLLGDVPAATQAYEEVLADWPPDGRLDEGLWRADLAVAYLDEGELERAAAEGLSALRVAQATSSARTVRAVGRILPRLRRHRALGILPTLAHAYRDALDACND
ncbi:helix-turn-helix domain-containing protein [Micromonospora halophytica]|uniref:Helix-turn-helix domain-containing protein n=1 Tax=Micromonospora halophytica TaxID=47864 RepID=A0A1C5H3E6_9ACTN|nr:helix-turn-helix domain-containing protein [Micromonospora halophytica]SCG40423.1 Helix-turn-helix domain-containing protein [Micromonospora halophytica]